MPLLFLERFPWPSLRTYTALSALALLAAALSAYRALGRAPEAAAGSTAELQARGGPRALDVASFLLADSLCVWVRPGMAAGGSALSAPPPPGLPRAPPPGFCGGAGACGGGRGGSAAALLGSPG